MFMIMQVSDLKYVVAKVVSSGSGNLRIYSRGRVGEPGEKIDWSRGYIVSKKLYYKDVLYLYCLLSKGAELTDDDREMLVD